MVAFDLAPPHDDVIATAKRTREKFLNSFFMVIFYKLMKGAEITSLNTEKL
jgi:hypothetical protein